MLKTLLKKQISELLSGLLHKNDTKKGKSFRNVFLYAVIYIYMILMFGFSFF